MKLRLRLTRIFSRLLRLQVTGRLTRSGPTGVFNGTRPNSEAMRVTRQLRLPPGYRRDCQCGTRNDPRVVYSLWSTWVCKRTPSRHHDVPVAALRLGTPRCNFRLPKSSLSFAMVQVPAQASAAATAAVSDGHGGAIYTKILTPGPALSAASGSAGGLPVPVPVPLCQ